RVARPPAPLREIPLAAPRNLPKARLQQRRPHLEREPEAVLRLGPPCPPERGLGSLGLGGVVLREAPEERKAALVHVERVALALVPSEIALPQRRSAGCHHIPGGADAVRARGGPRHPRDGGSPCGERNVRGQLFPDLLGSRGEPLRI